MNIAGLTDPAAVIAAMREYDELGQSDFLARYGFHPADSFFLEHEGRRYDSKAIAGVAYGQQHHERDTPTWDEFSGGENTVARALRKLGFAVVDVKRSWTLEPGEHVRRVELHDKYGGRRQGGIGPSNQSPNVLVFSDPEVGEQHGYFDRWEGPDEFHYAGEGQHGDQKLDQGNGAILNHRKDGRSIRLFWGSKGTVEYAGEFELDTSEQYYWVEAPETGGGPLRRVVMFRLHPVGTASVTDPARPARRTVGPTLTTPYRPVDPTKSSAPRDPFEVDPDAVDRGLRGHAETQELLASFARARGGTRTSTWHGERLKA